MNYIAAITSQGQLTIPKSLRDKYGITKQAKAVIKDLGNGMLVKTYTDKDFWALKGILKKNPIVRGNRNRKLADIIREEENATAKAISANAVSET